MELLDGAGRVELTTLPACTVQSYMHRGHYQELCRSYGALESLMEREGLAGEGHRAKSTRRAPRRFRTRRTG